MSRYDEKQITYAMLKSHSAYSDAWISIHGTVYDITHFIAKHPFGDTFRGRLGTECGGLFASAHSCTDVERMLKNKNFLETNGIEVMGRLDISGDHLHRDSNDPYLDRILYKDSDRDEFWIDLKTHVTALLKAYGETTHYTFWEGVLYLAYYLSIFILLSYLTWIQGSFFAAILLGFHMICALANIAHMATHFGLTRSRKLDFIASHMFDLSGMSGLEWQITHQTHHDQPHSSIDHQTNVYDYIGVRIHKYMQHKDYHKYQYIYFWLVVSAYLLFKSVETSKWLVANREFVRHKYEMAAHILGKGVLVALVISCAYIHGFWTALALFVVYSISYSQTAFILLFNDHKATHEILGETEDVGDFHGKMSWAEIQVRTSGNWYPTNWLLAFIEFHYGYFNYHIEHHLFPTFKPSLLKKISPVVKSVCEKHAIPYISTPFLDVQKSLQEHLSKLGHPHPADSSGANI